MEFSPLTKSGFWTQVVFAEIPILLGIMLLLEPTVEDNSNFR